MMNELINDRLAHHDREIKKMRGKHEQAQANVGKRATLTVDGWLITVDIVASRVCYGRIDYKVSQPQDPSVSRWVSDARVWMDTIGE